MEFRHAVSRGVETYGIAVKKSEPLWVAYASGSVSACRGMSPRVYCDVRLKRLSIFTASQESGGEGSAA
jgi:hypothetical protein